jgi:hypothetical protein
MLLIILWDPWRWDKYIETSCDGAKLGCNRKMVVMTMFQQSPRFKTIRNKNVNSTFYTFHFAEMWIGDFGTNHLSF